MAFIFISILILSIVCALYLVSFWAGGQIAFPRFGFGTSAPEKLAAYECGLEPMGDARLKFDILYCRAAPPPPWGGVGPPEYYIIGILFLIFDVEIVFLVPLAAIISSLNSFLGFSIM
jgi:NADH:ubiquinone oxidoreductase subunit 3 (subunit A)